MSGKLRSHLMRLGQYAPQASHALTPFPVLRAVALQAHQSHTSPLGLYVWRTWLILFFAPGRSDISSSHFHVFHRVGLFVIVAAGVHTLHTGVGSRWAPEVNLCRFDLAIRLEARIEVHIVSDKQCTGESNYIVALCRMSCPKVVCHSGASNDWWAHPAAHTYLVFGPCMCNGLAWHIARMLRAIAIAIAQIFDTSRQITGHRVKVGVGESEPPLRHWRYVDCKLHSFYGCEALQWVRAPRCVCVWALGVVTHLVSKSVGLLASCSALR